MHFIVPSWRGARDPPTAGGKNRIQPGDGTKTGYSSWERQQSARIRSDPAPRTVFHKTVVLCRLSIKAITSLGAGAERYVCILLSRLGGEAVTPIARAGSRAPHAAREKNLIQPGGGTKTGYSSSERRQGVRIRSVPAPRTNSLARSRYTANNESDFPAERRFIM